MLNTASVRANCDLMARYASGDLESDWMAFFR